MGTRSTIAVEYADGTIKSIYCHWDGYTSHPGVGSILHQFYQRKRQARALIDLGNISILGRYLKTSKPHTYYDPQKDVTVAYVRDLQCWWSREKYIEHKNMNAFDAYLYLPYSYLLTKDGVWMVKMRGQNKWTTLESHYENHS